MNKFGFWIIPEGEIYKELKGVIDKHALSCKTPVFEPHMTIMGSFIGDKEDAIKVVQEVAPRHKSFSVDVENVEFSSTYFQCVFARVKTSAKLFNLHLDLKKTLEIEEKSVFMPHISLVYGDLSMEMREQLSQEIKLSGKSFVINKIAVIAGDSQDPKDWKIVSTIHLEQ